MEEKTYNNEQEFKMNWLRTQQASDKSNEFFCIETEETVKGFPDVMVINKQDSTCYFVEFKYTKTGKIKFQPTQPAFYKAHPDLRILVIAYNARTKTFHRFGVACLFDKKSKHYMNDKAEVDLNKAEE